MDRPGLADFLRRRREALRPGEVGLPPGVRRRAPGLRREEVAALAGMSTDYYARIEQQRGPQPSDQVVAAIARALRFDLDERDHLFRLAGHRPPVRLRREEHIAPGLMRVLDRLDDTPAMIVSDLAETLVQNRLAIALLGDQRHHAGPARSQFHRWFTDPEERTHYPEDDHERQTRLQAAGLRAALSLSSDARAREVLEDLLRRSAEFREVWQRHEVEEKTGTRKRLVHPQLGVLEVDCQSLWTENRAQALLVFTGVPGTEAQEKLDLLQVIGTQQFAR
ncbi:helix-turn-helix transcriptional regulator [Kineococcus sp. R86509]|uniref:helix-turn-helix transcriptional regulator n=1 Tax=Kineococcus sp. R86509 TaxID=3093851 RepID=UPI0036D23622